jgi:nucleoside-diphosphate-sugar epimerase
MQEIKVDAETVLVTGGSGFVASWCIIELLRRGYRVQGCGKSCRPRARPSRHARALFDAVLRSVIQELDQQRIYSAAKAKKLLGWQPRPIDQSNVDYTLSLIDHGVRVIRTVEPKCGWK